MAEQAPRPGTTSNHDRLNGWKEIAVCLGRGVRTVQRWERELGLPIHRVRIETGEVVYALRTELDQWQARQEIQRGNPLDRNGGHDDKDIEATERVDVKENWRKRHRGIIALAIAVVVLSVVVWGTWHWNPLQRADRNPAFWTIEGDTVQLFNERGEKLWEHRFPFALSADTYTKHTSLFRLLSIALEDLDHDGEKELLLVTWGDSQFARRLICFNSDGSVRFDVQPNRSIRYGETNENPPFLMTGFMLTAEPDGTSTIWTAAVHNYEFPSVLWKLDRYGKVTGEYWSNGHINVIQESRFNGRSVILVGAMDNERVATSLAVLDYENPSGFAPAENPKYRCENCPQGSPLAFFIFPRTEMSRRFETRPVVSQIRAQPDGRVTVTVVQMTHQLRGEVGPYGADVWYTLDQRLLLAEAESGDMYRRLHSYPELMSQLKHAFGPKCEDEILPVLSWNGAKFVKAHRVTTAQTLSKKTLAQTRTP